MAGSITISTLNNDTGVLATQNGMTGIAKAWVNFAGASGTVNGSFNVSSVTRGGVGQYVVNFTTAMTNANYASIASNQQSTNLNPNYVAYFVTNTTSSSTILMNGATGGAFDPVSVFASFFSS
jgi:hypothetical protein